MSSLVPQMSNQFEIFALIFYWSGSMMPVGPGVITNLSVILLLNTLLTRTLFGAVFDRKKFNVWEFILISIYDLVKSIVRSNTSLKRNQYFALFFFLFCDSGTSCDRYRNLNPVYTQLLTTYGP